MTVESVTYITDLNSTYPAAGDSRTEGDDHIRNIKTGLAGTFSNFTGAAVTSTEAELNYVDVTPGTATASKAVVLDGSKGAGTITTATITNMTSTNVNIDGGNIDGTIIGASTQAAGSFDALTGTVVTASATLSLATGATVTGINDTDAMTDASATTLATSESIKAYADGTYVDSGTQGSMTFGNGLIVKWGNHTIGSVGVSEVITFTAAFPNDVTCIQLTDETTGDTGGKQNNSVVSSYTTSAITVSTVNNSDFDVVHWIAIGN